jgi:hypothetical protein
MDAAGPGGKTVVTTMKNEGAFLIEWAAHYLTLGFDRLVICTNDCEDPTPAMARRLQALGLGRHHATTIWAVTSIQRAALKQAFRYPEVTGAAWVFVCDADEFLAIHTGDGSVDALIGAATPEAEVICVPWRLFGPDGRAAYEDTPVTRQFTRAQAQPRRVGLAPPVFCKSVSRGGLQLKRPGIHSPIPHPDLGRSFIAEMPGGRRIEGGGTKLVLPDFRVAQVNHYALRSAESFLVKRDRGRVNHTNQVMNIDYWDRHDIAEEESDLIRRYDDAAGEWRARLMADRELADLHAAAVAWHRGRIAELQTREDFAETVAAIAERLAKCARLAS